MERNEKPAMKQLTVRFPPYLLGQLQASAKSNDRSLNAEIVRALRHYIEEERHAHSEAGQ